MGHLFTMKLSIVVAVLFLVGFTFAQDYAFLVYWSDGRCQNFAGFRQMTENNQFVTAASGSSCKQEMYCLNDAGSADCAAIAVLGGGQISIRTDNSRTVTEFFDNDAGTQYTSSSCVESNLYSNCWFNYYTEDQAPNCSKTLLDAIK